MTENTPKKKNWFVRHKIITVIIFLFVLGSLLNGIKTSGSTAPSPAPDATVITKINNSGLPQTRVLDVPHLLTEKFPQMKAELTKLCGKDVVADAEQSKSLNCLISHHFNLYFELTSDGFITADGVSFIGHTQYGDTDDSILIAAGVVRNPASYHIDISPADALGDINLDVKSYTIH